MTKKIRLFDYKDSPKEIEIKDFENVKIFIFEIISGDGILTVVYNNNQQKIFDSSYGRCMAFSDGMWVIDPKDIDVLNRMKSHYDTDELDKLQEVYE